MNHKEIIKEATAGEITVGFELEIIIPGDESGEVGTRNEDGYLAKAAPHIQRIIDKYGLVEHEELSLQVDSPYTHYGTEFDIGLIKDENGASARLTATPANFVKVATIIKELFDAGGFTNESCGFHAHFGLGQIEKTSGMDTTWFIIYAMDNNLLEPFYYFNDIPQFDEKDYASINDTKESVQQFRDTLASLVHEENKLTYAYDQTVNKLAMGTFEKYNVLNPHQQGTLEWRGLRGALDQIGGVKKNYNMLVDYLKFVYKFARVLGQAQRNLLDYEIEGVSLRKLKKFYFTTKQEKKGTADNLLNLFRQAFEPIMPADKYKQAFTTFTKKIALRSGESSAKRYGEKSYLDALSKHMQFGAKALSQFIGSPQAWASPESRMITRLRGDTDRPGLEIDVYDLMYDEQLFTLDPKEWNELVNKFGWGIWDSIFNQCQFAFKNPTLYNPKTLNYMFEGCMFTDCIAIFENLQHADDAVYSWQFLRENEFTVYETKTRMTWRWEAGPNSRKWYQS